MASGSLKVAADGSGQASLRFTEAGRDRLRSAKQAMLGVSAGSVSKKVKLS